MRPTRPTTRSAGPAARRGRSRRCRPPAPRPPRCSPGARNVGAGTPGGGAGGPRTPGARGTGPLQPPQDAAVRSAASVAFSFHQAAPAPAGQAAPSATKPIARLFTLPVPLRLQMTGAAVAQPSASLENLIGRLAPPKRTSLLVSASSTWGSVPEFGPDNLFSATTTPWISGSSDPVIHLNWQGRRRISRMVVQPPYGFAAAPSKIEVTRFFGTREATIGLGGVATLSPPLLTDQLQLSFPGWSSAAPAGTRPGQAAYVEVHQNANPGWTATLNGRGLASARLDGWQQAFIVPAGAGGVITMTFAPTTLYHIGLALSVLAIIGLLAVAFGLRRWIAYVLPLAYFVEVGWSVQLKAGRGAALWVPLELLAVLAAAVAALAIARLRGNPAPKTPRTESVRRTPRAPGPIASLATDSPDRIRHRAAGRSAAFRYWIGPVAVGVLVFLIGGPVVLTLPLLAAIAAPRPRWLPVISLAPMLLAGPIAATAAPPPPPRARGR